MAKYGLVIDITRCDGCGSCLLAVKDEYVGNNYPGYCATQPRDGHNWLNILEVEQGENMKVKADYIPLMYRHNRNLRLPDGVPAGAMYVRPDGLTIIDPVKAKGCKQIADSCKDGTIFWNEELQIPQIYTLDAHRLDAGEKLPRCVESCPTQAMHWGDLDDPNSDVSQFTLAHQDEIEDYMPEAGADYAVRYYKLPKPFITGEVTLADRQTDSPEGAKVVCECDCGSRLETETDFFGDFQFKYLKKDSKCSITVYYPGYKPFTTTLVLDKARDLGVIALEKDGIGEK